ncbi:MAG: M67 family metallopeptidase [Candidatus Omnitrophica bacterium]|nr:M67 family metallopeptidase [Candidatus Omnitrophota bacterium]
MISLSRKHIDDLVEYSKKEAPSEACGILAGPPTPEEKFAAGRLRRISKVTKIYLMANADNSGQTFLMDPKEQLKVTKEIRTLGLEMVGIYHSHLETEAFPSSHDVKLAYYPDSSYVIVSIKDEASPSVRSFKIVEGKITEEEIEIK